VNLYGLNAVRLQPEFRQGDLPLIIHIQPAPVLDGIDLLTHPSLWEQPTLELFQATGSDYREPHVGEIDVPLTVPIAVESGRIA